jgi:hypothetical protein
MKDTRNKAYNSEKNVERASNPTRPNPTQAPHLPPHNISRESASPLTGDFVNKNQEPSNITSKPKQKPIIFPHPHAQNKKAAKGTTKQFGRPQKSDRNLKIQSF